VKEIGIPVYNDPNHQGLLIFSVQLKSTPVGPKIGDISQADVAIACVPLGNYAFFLYKNFNEQRFCAH